MQSNNGIPATWMRGGTSKGLFFLPGDLPSNPEERDKLLLRVMGSPDPHGNQINGLGGATSSTSKVCIVGASEKPDCDVDFLFGHVSNHESIIDFSGSCGNLSSAVGIYAIQQELVKVCENSTAVRIWQKNLDQLLVVHVPTDPDGRVVMSGDTEIAGVAGTGAAISVEFIKPGFDAVGHVFPTGNVVDDLIVPHVGEVQVTLINAGNPTVFVEAQRLHLHGTETLADFAKNKGLLEKLENIRCAAAIKMGLGSDAAWISKYQPTTPKVCLLAPSATDNIDIVARPLSMGMPHHAMSGTSAIALAVAAVMPGTLAWQMKSEAKASGELIIGHAAGTMVVSAQVDAEQLIAESASMIRTARSLMQGRVFF